MIAAAVAVGVSTMGCASQQADVEAAPASTPAPSGRASAPTEVDAKVDEFLSSIADRQKLMERTGAESSGRALLTAAEKFYAEHQERLRRAFESSVRQLPEGPRPSAERARLVGTMDAPLFSELDQRRRMARFQLVIESDVRRRARRALHQTFVLLATEKALIPTSQVGGLQFFFSFTEPSYAMCGEQTVCISYGATDTFVVSFELVDEELWIEDKVTWWTTAPSEAVGSALPSKAAVPTAIEEEEELQSGLVEFRGMVRPTKGGVSVRGVTFAVEHLVAAVPSYPDIDAMLGDRVRIVAELEARDGHASTEGVVAQARAGPWFVPIRLVSAVVVDEAVVIEGDVQRSKGLYSVGGHLVRREDLAWALGGRDPLGRRVRLWGQPRTVDCPPMTQCLVSGSLPMFDVGRAELVE